MASYGATIGGQAVQRGESITQARNRLGASRNTRGKGTESPTNTTGQQVRDTSGDQAQAAQFRTLLDQWELGELAPMIDRWIRDGLTWDQVWVQLMDPSTAPGKVVDRIYPELREVRENGLPPVTIADVLHTRQLTFEGLSQRGVEKYLDPVALARQWTVNGVSVNEGLSRVDAVADDALAFARSDPEMSAQLEGWQRFYGVAPTAHDILAMAVKPDLAVADIKRRADAVRFDVEAGRAGFGDLSREEAESLTNSGVDARQSGGTFGALVANRELFSPLDSGEDAISRQEQLSAGFSNSAAAQKRIEDRRRRRLAQFGGGGGVAVTREGFGGLRPA